MAFHDYGSSFNKRLIVVPNLIIITCVVFLAQMMLKQYQITELASLHHYSSPDFRIYQAFSCIFLHSTTDFRHIIFNMFCLYTFGSMLERVWGPKKFLLFYVVCGIGASIALLFSIPFSAELFAKSEAALQYGGYSKELIETYKVQYSALGASGAVMGVEAAFVYLFPNTPLMMMFIPIPVKAKFVIPLFILIDLLGAFGATGNSDVAHFAHLGGALIGFLLTYYWNKTNKNTFY